MRITNNNPLYLRGMNFEQLKNQRSNKQSRLINLLDSVLVEISDEGYKELEKMKMITKAKGSDNQHTILTQFHPIYDFSEESDDGSDSYISAMKSAASR